MTGWQAFWLFAALPTGVNGLMSGTVLDCVSNLVISCQMYMFVFEIWSVLSCFCVSGGKMQKTELHKSYLWNLAIVSVALFMLEA